MYDKKIVSPLELTLDPKNPRFIVPDTGDSQANIRNYLLAQEGALSLARGLAEHKGLMPGERIVVCIEDGKYIVLEGNRRTCVCQLFLNRDLLTKEFENEFPETSDELRINIQQVEVDVIKSREAARRFLAVRHIERAREWKPIAKMRFCFEDYIAGKSVSQISDRTGIPVSSINKFIRAYKILKRGLDSNWSNTEKEKLNILNIEPSKLLRIFQLQDTKKTLKLYFDDQFVLRSNTFSDNDLDAIIKIWTKKAFIEDAMNTRTEFFTYNKDGGEVLGASVYVKNILGKYSGNVDTSVPQPADKPIEKSVSEPADKLTRESVSEPADKPTGEPVSEPTGGPASGPATESTGGPTSVATSPPATGIKNPSQVSAVGVNTVQPPSSTSGGGPKNLPFFSSLNWSNVDPTISANKGIISVCNELKKISDSSTFINNYPICTAFIIRALIEQSFKYHARTKGYFSVIRAAYNAPGKPGGDPTLSFIIKQYDVNIRGWIPEQGIRRLFPLVFNFNSQTEKLNMVVHSPESYQLAPETLKSIPQEGLLEFVNYLLR
ncbi:hypothetical protein PA598K_04071 [Paenibacillus sp. 598K]|uniref:PT domain-containing protein n=1 Tax=Paenibacillus sp. 598K TaxID=1117987 RepID=UPI000FF93529|nr:PT domain-containing protein [Paenibacillus sp. 598K]GBF75650.1 hypothetical protein PA598K_04071 [Paenibacillus sp. 598K]